MEGLWDEALSFSYEAVEEEHLEPGDQLVVEGRYAELIDHLAKLLSDVVKNDHETLKKLLVEIPVFTKYYHHGLYMGDGKVAQFNDTIRPSIADTKDFLDGRKLFRVVYPKGKAKPPAEVIAKAKEIVEADNFGAYNILKNNCEHFAMLCKTGIKFSMQAIVKYGLAVSLLQKLA